MKSLRTMVVEARQELVSSRQIAITQLHMQAVETTQLEARDLR